MNRHDDLEPRLRSWMVETAPSHEPTELIARAVDRIGSVRQRPASLVRTGLQRREFALPELSRPARVLLLTVLLLIVVAATAAVGAALLRQSPLRTELHLAYVVGDDIYVAEWDGAKPVRIFDGESGANCRDLIEPDGLVSPDGRHVAYRSSWGDGCDGRVIITDLTGNLVASFPGEGRGIAWSPDSTRIATWLTPRGPMIGIYGIDGVRQAVLDGTHVCCDQDVSRPYWSHDGGSLVIRRHRDDPVTPIVWELPVNGDPARPVPEDDPRWSMATTFDAAYSPDGTRMAFVHNVDDYTSGRILRTALVVAATDGTQRQVLIELDASDLEDRLEIGDILWSPSGDLIAYTRGRRGRDVSRDADGNPTLLTSDLWVVDPMTGTMSMLATAEGSGPIRAMAFSPDGDQLLFLRADENRDESLWSVRSDGSGAPRLVVGTKTWGSGSFESLGSSPEGDRILVAKSEGPDGDPARNRSLWSVNTDGSGARMLVADVDVGVWLTSPAVSAGASAS